ncbi:GT4 family glycosyltransferase PelF [Fulvimarina endophytica]|uniref:GT4 family glycosyltransferase PelF n=1 Tax=Fulvimarina endophytica TaxID=2293836 RepID=UPI0018F580D5|nr:GT4 family glycosyltransferase PelF [Fulvimarina endophytica]
MIRPFDLEPGLDADICVVVEGCYPHVSGGVSTWVDWLLRNSPSYRFAVTSIVPGHGERQARYGFPPNLVRFRELELGKGPAVRSRFRRRPVADIEDLVERLTGFLKTGSLGEFTRLEALVNDRERPLSFDDLMRGETGWALCVATYERLMPHTAFKDFFWAYQALVGGLFSVLTTPLSHARTYHTISTGYAGLLAARAALNGAPNVILTEHGIYTNERRIEILMSEWIGGTIDKGLADGDGRDDVRDFWVMAFESFARVCYETCSSITTLFGDNQSMQRLLGAEDARLQVIANGIDVERFVSIAQPPGDAPPTVSLIGRVVPIKDIKTFLQASRRIADAVGSVRILIGGSMDEDPRYASECQALSATLGLGGIVQFLGQVDVRDLVAKTHVAVLTSLSEAQPLTVLEAGAAGRPCVTTDVGACREMIEVPGAPGGVVTDLLNAEQIADAVVGLLTDEARRLAYGRNLQERVCRLYTSERSAARYHALYEPAATVKRRAG